MIAIVNIDKHPRKTGRHTYSLRINASEICTFNQWREHGLAVCLAQASAAAKLATKEEL